MFKPNPYFYGPKSNAEAVAMTYYTNSTSMIADLDAGNIDFADQVPFNAISSLKSDSRFHVQSVPSSEVTNITINSNPLKPKNRELLNPKLREALEYATDRAAIVKVIFAGYAQPWANMLSLQSGTFWLNPAIKPLPFDTGEGQPDPRLARATRWARAGSGWCRRRPASTPSRRTRWSTTSSCRTASTSTATASSRSSPTTGPRSGSSCTRSRAATAARPTASRRAGKYTKFDFATWDWAEYVDPDAQLSYMTRGAVVQLERHRLQQPHLRPASTCSRRR